MEDEDIPGKLHLAESVPTRGMFTLCTTQPHINGTEDEVEQEGNVVYDGVVGCSKYTEPVGNQARSQLRPLHFATATTGINHIS
jgi:hypothetical protein